MKLEEITNIPLLQCKKSATKFQYLVRLHSRRSSRLHVDWVTDNCGGGSDKPTEQQSSWRQKT